MRKALFLSFAVVSACTGGPELDRLDESERWATGTGSGSGDPPEEPDIVYEYEQGRYIIGKEADKRFNGAYYFSVGQTPVEPATKTDYTVKVTASSLGANLIATYNGDTHSGQDTWFVDLILGNPNGPQVKIVGVGDREDSLSTSYFLKYRPTPNDPWVDYCGDPTMAAIPLKGRYNKRRIHENGDRITFACDDGAAAKCDGWGYTSGNTGPGTRESPTDWDYHQACTAMANADYCRFGEPHTFERTPILIRDYKAGAQPPPQGTLEPFPSLATPSPALEVVPPLQHPDPFPGHPDQYYIEAAWLGGSEVPYCLSSIRWNVLPLDPCRPPGGGECLLPDPRVDPTAKTCDELTFQELEDAGVLIVNASKAMDMGIQRWRRPAGPGLPADEVTTIRGFFIPTAPNGNKANKQRSTLPFGPAEGYTEYLGPVGTILRNLTGGLEEQPMVELFAWQRGGDRVIASTKPVATEMWNQAGFEGYAFSSPGQVGPEFTVQRLWVCPSGNGYDLSFTNSGGCTTSGFALPPVP